MLTRKRIRELLCKHALTKQQMDDIAAYCNTVQIEMTEQDVRDIANKLKKRGD